MEFYIAKNKANFDVKRACKEGLEELRLHNQNTKRG